MAQQTAMQQLIKWMEERSRVIPFDQGDCYDKAIELLQMEKEQHEQTWNAAHQAGRFEGKGIAEENWQTFRQYYNETYGKDSNESNA